MKNFQKEENNILIRTLKLSDAPEVFQMLQDKDVINFLPFGSPQKIKDSEKFIKDTWQKIEKKEDFTYGIIDKELNDIIGCVFFPEIDKENQQAEIGLWLGKKYWGKGYNYKALRLMISYGFKDLKLNRIWAKISTENMRSLKTFEKLGFKQERILRQSMRKNGTFFDMVLCSILREEYQQ